MFRYKYETAYKYFSVFKNIMHVYFIFGVFIQQIYIVWCFQKINQTKDTSKKQHHSKNLGNQHNWLLGDIWWTWVPITMNDPDNIVYHSWMSFCGLLKAGGLCFQWVIRQSWKCHNFPSACEIQYLLCAEHHSRHSQPLDIGKDIVYMWAYNLVGIFRSVSLSLFFFWYQYMRNRT